MPDRAAGSSPQWLRAASLLHPFPTLMNVITTAALALVALRGRQDPPAILHLMLAMLAIQASIGAVNDLVDRDPDRASGRAKPLVQGVLSVSTARVIAIACLAAAIVLSAGFGAVAWLLAIAGLGCGLVYDFWLKRTPASGLPYAVALPLLPIWVWVALGQFQPVLLALVPLAGCIGLALHLANGLTDFDSDVLVGSGGLVQRLGKRSALFLCWGSFGLALVLVVASAMAIPYQESLLAAGLCAATLALASAIVLYLCRPVQRSLQIGWAILVSATAILALTWIASLPR